MKYIKLGHGVSRVFFLRNHSNARNNDIKKNFCDKLFFILRQAFMWLSHFVSSVCRKKTCAIFCEEQKSVANFYFVCERKYS